MFGQSRGMYGKRWTAIGEGTSPSGASLIVWVRRTKKLYVYMVTVESALMDKWVKVIDHAVPRYMVDALRFGEIGLVEHLLQAAKHAVFANTERNQQDG